jgi:signal peptidase II
VSRKAAYFWPALIGLVSSDGATKHFAQTHLVPARIPHPLAGEVLRLTLTYNRGAAFGLDAGPHERWLLVTLSTAVLLGLAGLYHRATASERLLVFALGLTAGGAIGNLLDRIRSPRGVVDFIDLGLGGARFWIFNLADAGISVGAILLGLALWRRLQLAPPAKGAR